MSINSDYYNNNADDFIAGTINCDMTFQYGFFKKHLVNAKTILDLGFGSGRDSIYFSKWYEVYSIDPTKKFCDYAVNELKLKHVYCGTVEEMDFENLFDGIWACASLLHVKSENLNLAFKNCSRSLRKDGVMYASFKYGNFEGFRKGRFFLDLNEQSIQKYLQDTGLIIIDKCITDDVRPDRTEKWLNIILKKK